jgi:hypothetical protein
MRNAISLWIICFLGLPCAAQEQDSPKKLIGFLQPGMRIGIVTFENSDRIAIEVYTEEDHAIAVDSFKMPVEELAAKYERLAIAIARKREEVLASLQAEKVELPDNLEHGEPRIRLRYPPTESFYQVVSVGDDYFLATNARAPGSRRAFATRYVSSINWRDEIGRAHV